MTAVSLQTSVRALLRHVLQELDVAGVCIEAIRVGVQAQQRSHATAAAIIT